MSARLSSISTSTSTSTSTSSPNARPIPAVRDLPRAAALARATALPPVATAALMLGLLLLGGALPARAAGVTGAAWDPDRTWVFVVGILEWEDSETFDSFPKEHRRDAQLVRFFREAGVARDHLVYLQDRAATTARIQRQLRDMMKRTKPGDLLIFYFNGHGTRADGRLWLASYDATEDEPGWDATRIPDLLDREFHGNRVLLLVDTCHSGALAGAVKRSPRRADYAILTSSTARQEATGDWTFTEAILDGFRGRPWADGDGDGAVELSEVAGLVKDDLAFTEDAQTTTFTLVGRFDGGLRLASAPRPAHRRIGERVVVRTDGDWFKARVIGVEGSQLKVHYFGFDHTEDELVRTSQLRGDRGDRDRGDGKETSEDRVARRVPGGSSPRDRQSAERQRSGGVARRVATP